MPMQLQAFLVLEMFAHEGDAARDLPLRYLLDPLKGCEGLRHEGGKGG